MQINKYLLKKIKTTNVNNLPISKNTQTRLVYTFADTNIDAVSFINDEKRFDGDEIHPQR